MDKFNKTDFIIDLTSLLDVIFIVLLIVMCSQQLQADNARAEALKDSQYAEELVQEAEALKLEAMQLKAEAESDKLLFESHMSAYEQVDSYVLFVDVTSNYNPSFLSSRTVKILNGLEEDAEIKEIQLTAESESYGYTQLQNYLEEAVSQHEKSGNSFPIILSLNKDDDNILYRDELAIENIFKEIAKNHENVYLR